MAELMDILDNTVGMIETKRRIRAELSAGTLTDNGAPVVRAKHPRLRRALAIADAVDRCDVDDYLVWADTLPATDSAGELLEWLRAVGETGDNQ